APIPTFGRKLWENTIRLVRKTFVLFHYDETALPPITRSYSCPYSANREYLFNIPENKDDFFNNTIRSWIVDYILRRKPFAVSTDNSFAFGEVDSLLKQTNIFLTLYLSKL
ncbi:unnamed protein product, partial [Lymnaea stagnalis]